MLVKAIVSEKTLAEANKGRYAFAVKEAATKPEIKQGVEKTFGVNVVKVQTMIMPGKSYRTGKRWRYAYRPDWKKAVVTVKPGQKIDLFDIKQAEQQATSEVKEEKK